MAHYRYTPVLAHHGILGMKWGIRRFRNKDGSLTSLGKIRAKDDAAVEQAKTNLRSAMFETGGSAVYNSVRRDAAYKQLRDAKALRQLHTHKKSNRQQKLENKYLEKGMTPQDAEIAAYKRVKTERALLAVGGLTVAAAAAYITHKHFKENADRYIDSSVKLKRVASNSDAGVHDAFYAAYKKGDVDTYVGLYGNTTQQRNGAAFQKTLSTKGMKIAGGKAGRKTLGDLINSNPSVKEELKRMIDDDVDMSWSQKHKNTLKRAIDKGSVPKNAYDLFNQNLVFRGRGTNEFYNELKRKGYSGILDVNDMKYSGYKAKTPLIIFDKSKVAVDGVRKLKDDEINYNLGKFIIKERAKATGKAFGKTAAIGGAAGLAIGKTVNTISKANNQKTAVFKYRAEHPGTKLSDKEILDRIVKREE